MSSGDSFCPVVCAYPISVRASQCLNNLYPAEANRNCQETRATWGSKLPHSLYGWSPLSLSPVLLKHSLSPLFFNLKNYIFIHFVGIGHLVYMWRLELDFWESVFFYPVDLWDQTQVIGFSSRYVYPLSHLAGPITFIWTLWWLIWLLTW